MSESLKHILILTTICFIAASLLAGVSFLTKPNILQQKAQAEKAALEEVMAQARYFEAVPQDGQVLYFRAYSSSDKKKILGYAFRAQAAGYSGMIESMVGMDTRNRITGVKILAHSETPGLGAKVEEVLIKKTLWQAIKELFTAAEESPQAPEGAWFCAQFKGKMVKDLIAVTSPTEKNIQAITGATISSKALTDSVRKKAKEILKYEQ